MKLSLPFLNRQRYIVLKCYHKNLFYDEFPPVIHSSKLDALPKCDVPRRGKSFRTCASNLMFLKSTATVLSHTEFDVTVDKTGLVKYDIADSMTGSSFADMSHTKDQTFNQKNVLVTKLALPYKLEEKTGVKFVMGSHIRNTTELRIPTGMLDFKSQHTCAIFNLVSKRPHTYTVPFNTPVLAIHPMSDLPLHVECIYDPAYANALHEKTSTLPTFVASGYRKAKGNI